MLALKTWLTWKCRSFEEICFAKKAVLKNAYYEEAVGVVYRKDVTLATMDGCNYPSETKTVRLTDWFE